MGGKKVAFDAAIPESMVSLRSLVVLFLLPCAFFFFGGVGVKASLATPRCRVNDYYSNSTLSHTLKAEDDSGYNVEMTPTGTDDGVDPALDLVRTMSMSTDKDILKQLRDAMNPKQKQQTWIMMFQAFM